MAQDKMPQARIRESFMRCLAIFFWAIAVASSGWAQQQPDSNHAGTGATTSIDVPRSSVDKLGPGDVIAISVYDSPELTRNVRVDAEGKIRLPMVRQHIQAAGLIPDEIEKAIAAALIDEQVLVSPIVTVTVVEQHSRPITVLGAVRGPTTFEATGNVTLLEAIMRAGGIANTAGAEILVTHPAARGDDQSIPLTERFPVHSLMDVSSPISNVKLEGGETIRVPEAGQVWVVGNVKRPGPFQITNDSESSVIKAMALSGGLDSYSSGTAYIYRTDGNTGRENEIPIPIKKIVARKSPDVPLYGNDMLYVPSVTGERISAKAFGIATGLGIALTFLMIYVLQQ
jgi:polysaccharide export outer membrane protein